MSGQSQPLVSNENAGGTMATVLGALSSA